MKILHIVSALNAGGVETLLYSYYNFMNREDFKFDFAVTCGDLELGVYADKFKELGCSVYKIPSKKNIFKYHKKLKDILKLNKYDVVHVHQDEKSFQSLFCAKKSGVKIRIAHAHHCYKVSGFISKLLRKLTLKFCTHQFACTSMAAEYMFGDSKDTFIMNNAIDLQKFKFDKQIRNEIRKDLKFSDDDIVIGTIARVAEQKNPLFLIDVISEIKKVNSKVKFCYIGNGPMFDDVQKHIKNLELGDSCLMLGEKFDAYKYYNAFDIFLLPSIEEGFGISALESQANGLLTIISDGFPKSVKVNDDGVEFIELDKPASEWARIICEKLNNKIKRIESKLETTNYSIDKAVKLLENKYKEMKSL